MKDEFIDNLIESWGKHASRNAIEHGDALLTYGELNALTRDIAADMRLRASRRVALVDRSDLSTRVYYFAIARAGATVVPLSPEWPALRLSEVLNEAAVDMIVDPQAGVTLDGWVSQTENTVGGTLLMPDEVLSQEADTRVAGAAYILFTSGSTGRPKGVPVAWTSVSSFCRAVTANHSLTCHDRVSATFGLTFDVSVFDIFAPATVGATSVLPRNRGHLASTSDYINDSALTVWFSVPGRIDLANRLGDLTEASLSTLRQSMFIGEQLSFRQACDWAVAASRSEIHNLYGPTEAAVACLSYRVRAKQQASGAVPIGVPYPGVEVSIGSLRHERELLLSGVQVFEGYLRDEDTTTAFEEKDGRRWYRTGDIVAESPEGFLFESRIDRQVKVSGYRVELGDVEAAFLASGASRAHAFVEDVDGATSLIVCVTHADYNDALRGDVHDRLPAYMRPRLIVPIESFPLTSSGKVDGFQLRRSFRSMDTGRR